MTEQRRNQADRASNGGQALYPKVFTDLDQRADQWQRRFLALQRSELACLLVAAVALELGWIVGDVALAPLGGAVALLAALACRFAGQRLGLETAWMTSRGAAETVKSVIWRHGATTATPGTDDLSSLRSAIADVLHRHQLERDHHEPIDGVIVDLRNSDDDHRRDTYLRYRVREQQRWYRDRAKTNKSKARGWSRVVIACEAGGVAMAVAQGLQWVELGWAGILGAAAAAAVAWRQTKQFAALATTYRAAAEEVEDLAVELATAPADRWNELVDRTEDALGREHKLWALRRSPS